MDFKRILRAPLFWVVAVVAITLMVFSAQRRRRLHTHRHLRGPAADHRARRSTSVTITDNEVVDLDLKKGQTYSDGKTSRTRPRSATQFVDAAGPGLHPAAQRQPAAGRRRPGRSRTPTRFVALLGSILPVIILLGLFWFLMNQMQGGGSRVMQFGKSQGQARHQGHPEGRPSPTSPVRTRPSRSSTRSRSSWPSPPSSRPSAPRSPRACCSTARPAPARPCSPAPSPARPACRSTRSPAPTSSRCSSASAPPASATCSSRPRPTPRPSSSSTRSTPSAATAAPASAAATTSASRRSTSCSSRWTASTSRPTSSSSPRPTAPTSSTRRCCARAASTARSRSRRPT